MATASASVPEGLRGDTWTERVIKDRIWAPPNRNDNWSAFCMVGREGSGKSHTVAAILERADPSFVADRVFFEPEDLIGFIADLDTDERTGKAVLLDEAGVGMGVRSWYQEDQIKVNKAAQTMRDDNMILGLTLPSFGQLDSQLRTRMHGFCEMRGLDIGESATWSWKDVIVNREEGGSEIKRKKFPRYPVGQRMQKIERLCIGPPSDEFIGPYEEEKAAFKQAYYEEVAGKDEEEDIGAEDVVAEVVTNDRFDEFTTIHGATGNEYIDKDKLYMEFSDDGLTHRDARGAKKAIQEEWEGPE